MVSGTVAITEKRPQGLFNVRRCPQACHLNKVQGKGRMGISGSPESQIRILQVQKYI